MHAEGESEGTAEGAGGDDERGPTGVSDEMSDAVALRVYLALCPRAN